LDLIAFGAESSENVDALAERLQRAAVSSIASPANSTPPAGGTDFGSSTPMAVW